MINLLEKHDANSILGPHLPVIEKIMIESLDSLNDSMLAAKVPINNRGKSSWLHSIISSKIEQYFKENCEIKLIQSYESIQLVFEKKLVGRVKKLNKNNLSRNAPSIRNSNILTHQLSIFPNTNLTFIDLGYRVNETWTAYDTLIVVCRINTSIVWVIPFKTQEFIITTGIEKENVIKIKDNILKIKKAQ